MGAAASKGRPPLVFLDSNVIFSGLHSPGGAPGTILELMLDGRIEVVVSSQILEEVVRTFSKKLPQALPALREFLLNSPMSVVSDPEPGDCRRWTGALSTGDASIMAAAVRAESDFLVTGDSHFLKNDSLLKSGLSICSPAQLLDILERRKS